MFVACAHLATSPTPTAEWSTVSPKLRPRVGLSQEDSVGKWFWVPAAVVVVGVAVAVAVVGVAPIMTALVAIAAWVPFH
jgi:hypothetical protein